jgi:hypothetical protein
MREREGYVARVRKRGGVTGCGGGKPEGKRPLRRPRPRWNNNFKTDLREMFGGDGVDLYGSE